MSLFIKQYEGKVEMLSPLPDPTVLLSLPRQQQLLFSDGFIGLKQDFGRILAHFSLERSFSSLSFCRLVSAQLP